MDNGADHSNTGGRGVRWSSVERPANADTDGEPSIEELTFHSDSEWELVEEEADSRRRVSSQNGISTVRSSFGEDFAYSTYGPNLESNELDKVFNQMQQQDIEISSEDEEDGDQGSLDSAASDYNEAYKMVLDPIDKDADRSCFRSTVRPYARFINRFPWVSLLLGLIPIIACATLLVMYNLKDPLYLSDDLADIFQVDNDVDSQTYEMYKKLDKANLSRKRFGALSLERNTQRSKLARPLPGETFSLFVVFEDSSSERNMLTASRIERARYVENRLMASPAWQKYCDKMPDSDECERPLSFTRFAFPSISSSGEFIRDGNGARAIEISQVRFMCTKV